MKTGSFSFISRILGFFLLLGLLQLYVGKADAACNDNPNTPNNGFCGPAVGGGQSCSTQRGSCNCTCEVPIA